MSQDIASQYQSVLWEKFIPKFNTVGTYLSNLKKNKEKNRREFLNSIKTSLTTFGCLVLNKICIVHCNKSVLKGLALTLGLQVFS